MRRPITLSVFLVLIAGCLAVPEPLECAPGDLSVACSSQGIFTTSLRQTRNVEQNIARPAKKGGCECVPYYQCQNNTITTEGIGLIDIRDYGSWDASLSVLLCSCHQARGSSLKEESLKLGHMHEVKGECESYLETCCMPPNVLKPEDKITTRPRIQRDCGQRNPGGVGVRITGDKNNEAQFGEFPWMVAILREEMIGPNTKKPTVYQCGGALIHYRAVITAAHCVQGRQPSELKVRAGEWDTQTRNEIFPHQDRDVEYVIVHEKFDSGSLKNDIAILILRTPVDLAENVNLVCLPAHDETFDAARCFANGWGKDIFGKEGHYQVILKKIELPVVPRGVCQTSLRNTRLGKYFILHSSFICAGGEVGKDTCKGDGGSPLVCPMKNDPSRYVQVGIVAWGIGCGENQTPGVYANVALFRPWIDEQLVYHII